MGGNGAAGRAAAERVRGLDGWDSPTDAVRWVGTGRLDGRPPRGSEGWTGGTLPLMPSDGRDSAGQRCRDLETSSSGSAAEMKMERRWPRDEMETEAQTGVAGPPSICRYYR